MGSGESVIGLVVVVVVVVMASVAADRREEEGVDDRDTDEDRYTDEWEVHPRNCSMVPDRAVYMRNANNSFFLNVSAASSISFLALSATRRTSSAACL